MFSLIGIVLFLAHCLTISVEKRTRNHPQRKFNVCMRVNMCPNPGKDRDMNWDVTHALRARTWESSYIIFSGPPIAIKTNDTQ